MGREGHGEGGGGGGGGEREGGREGHSLIPRLSSVRNIDT